MIKIPKDSSTPQTSDDGTDVPDIPDSGLRPRPNRQVDVNKLSVVSQQYDRGNKGYLDSTEQKIRKLDTDNLGYVDIHKVYALMQDFQTEQKKSLTLKWVVIVLSAFATLLCLANIGTSFAAATLAKDVTTDQYYGLLMDNHGGRPLATTHREPIIDVDAADGTASTPTPPALLNPINGTNRRLLSHRYHRPRGLHSHVTRGDDPADRTRQLLIEEYQAIDSNGAMQLTTFKVNQIMHTLCGNWDENNGVQNFDCKGLQNCNYGADRVRLMLPNGCGEAEIYFKAAPTCWDVGDYKMRVTSRADIRETFNWERMCQEEFGTKATVVDWDDILQLQHFDTDSEIETLMDQLGINRLDEETRHYFVTKGGNKWQDTSTNPDRAYFLEYTDRLETEADWKVYDEYRGLTLSSWSDITGSVLCFAPIEYQENLFHFKTRATTGCIESDTVTIFCQPDAACSVYGLSCS